jgi:hypothetical protein
MRVHHPGFALIGAAVAAVAVWAGCNGPSEDTDDSQGALAGTECEVLNVKENRPLTTDELRRLDDPVAKLVIAGKGACPATFSEIQAKLRVTDAKDCTASVSTRFVTERSQILGVPDSYRAVVARECGRRSDHELLISLFGLSPTRALPDNAELIAEDTTKGIFDYYAREDGKWKFFGTSLDLIADGYDCKPNGACTPKAAAKTRCASCHVGGGLIMKELNTPWLHWESEIRGESTVVTPGTEALIKKHGELLGSHGNGIDMERKVIAGNVEYLPKRVAFLKTKSVEEVLRPLFCTLDINLQSAQGIDFFALGSLILDPNFGGSADVPDLKEADYTALVKQFNQRVVDKDGKQLKGKDGKPIVDTLFKFTFPERSDIDFRYGLELIKAKVIDEDFARDVVHVDFTRPIFSGARCGLLKFAPKLSAAEMTPAKIRAGFIASLKGATELAAKQLLANLQAKDDQLAHQADVDAFLKKCKEARPPKALMADLMTYASHLRRAARANTSAGGGQAGQSIIEFSETMVVDDIPDTDKALDPATCTLK